MSLKSFLSIHAIIALVYGLGFIVMPGVLVGYFGGHLGPAGVFMGRLFGSALLTYAAVLWLARTAEEADVLATYLFLLQPHFPIVNYSITLGFFLTMIVGGVVSLHEQLKGIVNMLGWSTVALYFVLAACYGYYHFSSSRS